jgi:iron complex outermembrane receptor protein
MSVVAVRAAVLATAALVALPAFAASPAPAPATAESPATPAWRTPDIIVTAQRPGYAAATAAALRSDVPLLDVPQSVQVLNETLIREQDLRTLADALRNVSGTVPTQPGEAVLANPVIRGFRADIFVDGLPAYGATAVFDPASLVAYNRIEVAKGPTATLFGGGLGAPVGGLINLVSKTPGDAAAYRAQLRTGSFGTISGNVDLNQPLAGIGGARLTAEVQDEGSWIAAVRASRVALNPSLRFDLGPGTSLTLIGSYSLVRQLEYGGLPLSLIDNPAVDRRQFVGAPTGQPETRIRNTTGTASLDHRFSDSLSLNVRVRQFDSRFDEYGSFFFAGFFPPSGTRYPIITAVLPTTVKETTLDTSLTWRGQTGAISHVLLAGGQFDNTRYDAGIGFNFVPVGVQDLANPAQAPLNFGAVPTLGPRRQTDRYRTTAAFLQDQASIGPVTLLASLRWTEFAFEDRANGAADAIARKVNPRLGATVKLAEGVALFGGWATGFRGTTSFFGLAAAVPETSRSFEAGVKFDAKAIGLSGSVAAYDLKRRNVPTADPANPFLQVQTGEQQSQGVEADVIWEPSPSWSVIGNYAYTEAKVTQDTSFAIGARLARAPRHAWRLAVRYRVIDGALKGLGIGAGISAASASPAALGGAPVPDWATVDAQASKTFGPVTLGLNITNLFNRRYVLPWQYLNQDVVMPGAQRAAFVTLGVAL